MASKKVSNVKLAGQAVSVIVIMILLSGLVMMALQFQNYTLSISSSGIKWIPRSNVSVVGGIRVDNTEPEKLTLQANVPSGCDGVQFRLSTFQNATWFGQMYLADHGYKTLGKLHGGKNYYIQVRAYKKGVLNRNIYGPWSPVKVVKVRKKTSSGGWL